MPVKRERGGEEKAGGKAILRLQGAGWGTARASGVPTMAAPTSAVSFGELGLAQRHCWHITPLRNPQLQAEIRIHPNTSLVQGTAGIVPLDGAIVKELGFVNYISSSGWELSRGSR